MEKNGHLALNLNSGCWFCHFSESSLQNDKNCLTYHKESNKILHVKALWQGMHHDSVTYREKFQSA